jgi:single-strand DNA-binding protein
MANLNKVMLIGRLTRDPEVRTFSNGGKVAKCGFAVNNRKKDQQSGQWVDDPVFLDLEVFNRGETGKQADRVEETLRKGHQVFIEGHLRMDNWTDKEGQKRSKLVIVVDNFQYLEPRADGGAPRPSQAAPRRAEAGYPASGGGSYGGGDYDDPGAAGDAAEDKIPF